MTTQLKPQIQTNASLGRMSLSAFLAAWILVLSLAGVSPALHDWLHSAHHHPSEHDCDGQSSTSQKEDLNTGHFCGVTLLQSSSEFWLPDVFISGPAPQPLRYVLPTEANPVTQITRSYQARAPPIGLIV